MTLEGRDPDTVHLFSLFEYGHLPEGPMRNASVHSTALAIQMLTDLGDGIELRAGLRKLLEAKDCFVRQAKIDGGNPS